MISINNPVVLSSRGKSKRTHTTLRCPQCNAEVGYAKRNKRTTPTMSLNRYCGNCRKRGETKAKDTK